VRCGSGGLGEGDGEAERLELADLASGLADFVDAAGVIADAELMEGGCGIRQQVPDDRQDGAGDRGQGSAQPECSSPRSTTMLRYGPQLQTREAALELPPD
jgi:hypothetical protein